MPKRTKAKKLADSKNEVMSGVIYYLSKGYKFYYITVILDNKKTMRKIYNAFYKVKTKESMDIKMTSAKGILNENNELYYHAHIIVAASKELPVLFIDKIKKTGDIREVEETQESIFDQMHKIANYSKNNIGETIDTFESQRDEVLRYLSDLFGDDANIEGMLRYAYNTKHFKNKEILSIIDLDYHYHQISTILELIRYSNDRKYLTLENYGRYLSIYYNNVAININAEIFNIRTQESNIKYSGYFNARYEKILSKIEELGIDGTKYFYIQKLESVLPLLNELIRDNPANYVYTDREDIFSKYRIEVYAEEKSNGNVKLKATKIPREREIVVLMEESE
uniref:Uncharacterized protein n=1 Tax=Marinitoga okinawensis TaxID=389480 RepID=A0A9C7LLK4_9BACT|nr:hypothetical protein [Marinitoga okinawensis]CAI4093961.1 Hypothetical protein PMO1_09 [Marinitoga okinawensis]